MNQSPRVFISSPRGDGELAATELRLPFTRPELVSRPRLQAQIAHGLRGPLTPTTAPAGFGKTAFPSLLGKR